MDLISSKLFSVLDVHIPFLLTFGVAVSLFAVLACRLFPITNRALIIYLVSLTSMSVWSFSDIVFLMAMFLISLQDQFMGWNDVLLIFR